MNLEKPGMTLLQLANNVAAKMYEIDDRDQGNRPPDGDDFNLLWDALLDEFRAAGVELGTLIELANQGKIKFEAARTELRAYAKYVAEEAEKAKEPLILEHWREAFGSMRDERQ